MAQTKIKSGLIDGGLGIDWQSTIQTSDFTADSHLPNRTPVSRNAAQRKMDREGGREGGRGGDSEEAAEGAAGAAAVGAVGAGVGEPCCGGDL